MNTADRSIGSIDYAVRRRFAFVHVGSNNDKIETSWGKDTGVGPIAKDLYDAFMGNGNENKGIFAIDLLADPELDVNDIKIGHTYFLCKEDEDIEYFIYRIKYQIWPIYNEYIKDGLIDNSGEQHQATDRFAECLCAALNKDYKDDKVNKARDKMRGGIVSFVKETLGYDKIDEH